MKGTILVVDDEPKIVQTARDYLEHSGFRVHGSGDGRQALDVWRQTQPDLVVLDLNLPGLDGLDVCRTIRRESDVAIIMLTARVDEADRLIGLELGADDYIVKPFSPRELVARVRAVLRRTQGEGQRSQRLCCGDLEIHLDSHQILRDGEPLHLTRTEFDLLTLFAAHPGQVLSRAQLLEQLHGVVYDGYDRSVDAHVKNLRRKIERDPANPRHLLTVYGVGYRFVEDA